MIRQQNVTCDDCYFRRAGLCALSPDVPCPTFRPAAQGAITPSPEPRLLPQLGQVAAQYAAAS